MEQNNQNDAPAQAENVVVEQVAPETVETVVEQKPAMPRRKNGRNSRASGSSVAKAAAQSPNCGEIADMSTASEKLSGSNVNGYSKKQSKKPEEKTENVEDQNSDNPAETKQEKVEAEKEEHTGPSFEQKKFTPRTIEVTLEDKRPKNFGETKANDGVVSYNSADEAACKVSIFARIKSALKSIFGGKKKSKKFDKKKKFDKNFKKDFKGKKKFNNSKNYNKDGKNYNRRHQNRGNRRPQQNTNKD